MNFLGMDFIISSIIWLILVFGFMFTFRKKIFSFYYKQNDMELFVNNLQKTLQKIYPKLKFDFSFLEKLENEPNPQAKQYALIDNIINQYTTKDLVIKSTPIVPTKELWSSYVLNSKPISKKLPEDWLKRKAIIFQRDDKSCQKCSKVIDIKNSDIYMIKSLNDSGQYYLENLTLLCLDCFKIENLKRDESKTIKYLDIKDELYSLVK
ncbi:MAG TPA: HNH endonuclease [Arcobacter sp.]|nr:HNH endonuclease [Arcobacter sp.]